MLRIKEVLKEKAISQIELADKLRITPVGLNKIIKGNPTAETLIKIAEALDVDVKDLFESTKDSQSSSEPLYIVRDNEMVKIGEIDLLGAL
jgi:transcriptional regulator with XRE-family HTH domain